MDGVSRRRLEVTQEDYFAELAKDDGEPQALGAPVRCGISLHCAGDMHHKTKEWRENRRRLFNRLALDPERVYGIRQVHGQTVLAVDVGRPEDFFDREADGLVTERSDTVLSITVADCLPIFLFSAQGKARGLVHSGWKGTGIALRALDLLSERYGAAGDDVRAVIGPGIGSCCYEVDEARYRDFTVEFGAAAGCERGGRFFLDLRRANAALLRGRGVRDIVVIENCTKCEPAFGSYRREGKENFHNMLALFGRF